MECKDRKYFYNGTYNGECEQLTNKCSQCMAESLKEIKKCTIENAQFSYILRVDGQEIGFQGGECAEYFEKHYKDLGYKIVWIKSYTD